MKAAKFPESSPGVKEFPTITKTPIIAKIIEVKVKVLIFSLKKYIQIKLKIIFEEIL